MIKKETTFWRCSSCILSPKVHLGHSAAATQLENDNLRLSEARNEAELAALRAERSRQRAQEAAAAAGLLAAQHRTGVLAAQARAQTPDEGGVQSARLRRAILRAPVCAFFDGRTGACASVRVFDGRTGACASGPAPLAPASLRGLWAVLVGAAV